MYVRDRAVLAGYLRLAGASGRALARRAGLAQATVNHLVSGRRATCSARTAALIEQALGAPAGLLFAVTPVEADRRSGQPGPGYRTGRHPGGPADALGGQRGGQTGGGGFIGTQEGTRRA